MRLFKIIPSSLHLDYFLLMRAWACIMVIRQHVEIKALFPGEFWFIGNPNSGGQAVVAFFILSGYLINKVLITKYSFTPASLYDYYTGRIARIVPLYYFVTTLAIFFIFPYIVLSRTYLKQFFQLYSFTYPGGLPYWNQVYWTISVEVMFYLIAPLMALGLSFIFRSRLTVIVSIMALALIQTRWRLPSIPEIPTIIVMLSGWMGVFLLGGTLGGLLKLLPAYKVDKEAQPSSLIKYLRVLAGFLMYFALVFPWATQFLEFNNIISLTLFCATLLALFIIIIEATGGSADRYERKVSTIRLCFITTINRVGMLSYAIFIIHMLVVARINDSFRPILEKLLPYSIASLLAFGVSIVLTTVLAEFLFRAVEEPGRIWFLNQAKLLKNLIQTKLWVKNQLENSQQNNTSPSAIIN
jgi:peptidoglycan/LPS O-acetylase OafA/YrhL